MQRLTGKSILLAGGGFIGGGLARRYASEGAQVVVADYSLACAQSIVEEIAQAGGDAVAAQLDGSDELSIAETIALCSSTYGGLDGLHLNFASFADGGGDVGVLELPLEAFDETMRINARGYLLCTRAALPLLFARGGGAIIYTSSAAAYASESTRVAYAMSKLAIHGLMRHVAVRYATQRVRANCIAPGIVMNVGSDGKASHPSFGQAEPEFLDWAYRCQLNQERVGSPADIAAVGAMLMSDEGSFITGQVLNVDGGWTLRP